MDTEEVSWVVNEFGFAELGDERRTDRLIKLVSSLAQSPTASFPEALKTQAELTAAYRFFENDQIDPEDILQSHTAASLERIRNVPLVLVVQDTTELNFTSHKALLDAGPLTSEHCQGFFAHTTIAITPERVPIGVLSQLVWARDKDQKNKKATRRTRCIQEKESYKWLLSLQATIDIQASCQKTHFINVGDREADIYDLFLVERPQNVDLLVRAAQNRNVETEDDTIESLVEQVTQTDVAATVDLHIPKREKQPARQATLTVRYCPVTLCPPKSRANENLPSVKVWVIWAVEEHPQKG